MYVDWLHRYDVCGECANWLLVIELRTGVSSIIADANIRSLTLPSEKIQRAIS